VILVLTETKGFNQHMVNVFEMEKVFMDFIHSGKQGLSQAGKSGIQDDKALRTRDPVRSDRAVRTRDLVQLQSASQLQFPPQLEGMLPGTCWFGWFVVNPYFQQHLRLKVFLWTYSSFPNLKDITFVINLPSSTVCMLRIMTILARGLSLTPPPPPLPPCPS
jgi:hypothetical protein